jgi:glycosyltransferase involved in cell wall biosynthesis
MIQSIGHFPAQPHCFVYGGFDIQMNRVIDLLEAKGTSSIRVNPWDETCNFTVAHFWGGDESHALAFRFCRERGIPTIFSVLLPNPTSSFDFRQRARAWARRLIKGKQYYANADAVLVINEAQAQVAEQVVGIPRARIWVVPTIIDSIFLQKLDIPERNPNGHILCVGTICSRKNQLNLLRAALSTNNHVVLCGRFDDSEPAYRVAVEQELSNNPSRFHQISDVSPEVLQQLYLECSVLACVSNHETEPASILEAMICQRPIVTANRPYGRNSKFSGVYFCDPQNKFSITAALIKAIENPVPIYSNFNSDCHSSVNVISSYQKIYNAISEE